MKILLATTNEKKVKEFNALFANLDVDFITLKDLNCDVESPEDGDTFEANALQKARFYYDMFHMPVISDDSGIEVNNLNNFPGVQSKRWMEDSTYDVKVEKLLSMLDGKDAACQYKAVIAFVDKNHEVTFDGALRGKLVHPDQNNKDAFGYDIGFWIEDKQDLISNLPLAYKNEVSHRAQALRKFLEWIKTSY